LAFARECPDQSAIDQFEKADYVFTATVIETRLKGRNRTKAYEGKMLEWSGTEEVDIYFDPIEDFKGFSSDLRHLTTLTSHDAGGIPMPPGILMVFYTRKNGSIVQCAGTKRFYDSKRNVNLLRRYRDIEMLNEFNKTQNGKPDDLN
jgi:hypothetical protein